MINGNIKNVAALLPYVSEDLKVALEYLAATDFSKVENGEYELKGREVFARVNTYTTEPWGERRPEKHAAYIDVQFVAAGSEDLWYAPLEDCYTLTEDRLEKDDVAFYGNVEENNCVRLNAGDFAILFPWELHRPNCNPGEEASEVQKIVVKVKAK